MCLIAPLMDSFCFGESSGLVGILSVFSMALSNNVATFPLVEMLNDVIVPVWVINNDPALIFQHKEKENKGRHGHHFVAVSVSNSTSCDVCSKSMANKSALRCESKTLLDFSLSSNMLKIDIQQKLMNMHEYEEYWN